MICIIMLYLLTIQPSLNYQYVTLLLVNYLDDYFTIKFKKRVIHAKGNLKEKVAKETFTMSISALQYSLSKINVLNY